MIMCKLTLERARVFHFATSQIDNGSAHGILAAGLAELLLLHLAIHVLCFVLKKEW